MKNFAHIFLLFLLVSAACDDIHYAGNTQSGFKSFPEFAVSPQKALESAQPYLDASYMLRIKDRLSPWDKPTYDMIVVRGDWYYIARDNYPYKTLRAYIRNAVKVHVQTGKVVAPK